MGSHRSPCRTGVHAVGPRAEEGEILSGEAHGADGCEQKLFPLQAKAQGRGSDNSDIQTHPSTMLSAPEGQVGRLNPG